MYTIAFLLIPEFSLINVISAIETLRVANTFLVKPAYRWLLVTDTEATVPSSSGMRLTANLHLQELKDFDLLLVCGSFRPHKYENKDTQSHLRHFARHGKTLGSMEAGAYHLALAGILDGKTATAHYSSYPTFSKMFPKVKFVHNVFTYSDKLVTCAGGVSAVDLMLHLIQQQLGRDLALRVASILCVSHFREPHELQNNAMTIPDNFVPQPARDACRIMEQNIAKPMSIREVAVQAGLSRRQLDRLFRRFFSSTASDIYMMIRLSRARKLLRSSGVELTAIAESCGFISYAHFARCYKRLFSHSPRAERRVPLDPQSVSLHLHPVFDLHPDQNLFDPQKLL
jgi:AraC family carnitine catabolism transcriptional activator